MLSEVQSGYSRKTLSHELRGSSKMEFATRSHITAMIDDDAARCKDA